MTDKTDKKTKRYRGTMKYLDKQGIGYISPDIDIPVTPSSFSSNNTSIREGHRVEFTLKFNEKTSEFEAFNVDPVKVQCFLCKNYGHSSKTCYLNSRARCYACGVFGHFERDCTRNDLEFPRLFKNGGSLVGSNSTSKKSSLVSVKKNDDDDEEEEEEEDEDEDEDEEDDDDFGCIVCVKNVEDVKKYEEVEDCFILEFDPNEPIKFSNLSLNGDDSEDVSIIGVKGKVACRDYPHPRNLCGTHPFETTPHEVHCKMCYCYVCEELAPCTSWTTGCIDKSWRHCDAADTREWRILKIWWKKQAK